MNNGDDLPYYLAKGTKVVGVEANHSLCDSVREKWSDEVRSGRLILENVVLSAAEDEGEVDFYVHKTNHVLSRFPRPCDESVADFEAARVRQRLPSSIVRQYGAPHYIKLDLEHYDQMVLQELFSKDIYPRYISSEVHDAGVLQLMMQAGYTYFSLVNGPDVPEHYRDLSFLNAHGAQQSFSFPLHSAGPFGKDLRFPWLKPWQMKVLLRFLGPGWKDVHGSRSRPRRSEVVPKMRLTLWLFRQGLRRVWRRLRRIPFDRW